MARAYHSTVVDAPASRVWSVVRDFNGLATWWAAAVGESHIEDGKSGAEVGAMRNFRFGPETVRERLLSMSDRDRSYSYEFGEPRPFPVDNYVATLRVTPITDGDRAFVEYFVTFDCKQEERERWTAFFPAEVFAPALTALKGYLRGRS